jgi:hypothetical protein
MLRQYIAYSSVFNLLKATKFKKRAITKNVCSKVELLCKFIKIAFSIKVSINKRVPLRHSVDSCMEHQALCCRIELTSRLRHMNRFDMLKIYIYRISFSSYQFNKIIFDSHYLPHRILIFPDIKYGQCPI